jgi:hypothetical protein
LIHYLRFLSWRVKPGGSPDRRHDIKKLSVGRGSGERRS